ncbi:PaaI family thioesterase [Nocardioides bizhenqiangii]|uniref:YiiD C-terminal domain-containing protein n=1 Tax=Nocardioides bizhenqiangii TaxID=3095076 RepID=A0ABZ0ZLV2_9ACTN|nr:MULTISPECIES: YiiD C-terminal domain-containing protein [unclassified Nocardioides]MDZ5620924.1 YiiD C-terminal domain-containing protein [Nocardioides sp. HM23]WQQ25285.1 YiiD C-terminal domain-containing protein [Nocardioides sp. HM61]
MKTPEELTREQHAVIPILAAMGTRVIEAGDGRGTVELPAEPNVNHFGALYAGSLFTVAEVLGGLIPGTTFDFEGELAGFVPLVKSVEIRFLRPALGTVQARAELAPEDRERIPREALANGKSEFVLEAEVVDAAGTVVAATRGVYQVRRFG